MIKKMRKKESRTKDEKLKKKIRYILKSLIKIISRSGFEKEDDIKLEKRRKRY